MGFIEHEHRKNRTPGNLLAGISLPRSLPQMRDQEPVLRNDRADCRVGDWVLASQVPEWKSDTARQFYVPTKRSVDEVITEGEERTPDPAGQWEFLGSFYLDHSGTPVEIWRRVS
jgi:hypothetical protein